MAITPAFGLRARTAGEPEPDLTSAVVIQRATRQDMRRLAACLDGLAALVGPGGSGASPGRTTAIGRYTTALLAEIRAYHESQDRVLWPMISATAGQSVDLIPLSDDHEAIAATIRDADGMLEALSAAGPGALAGLRASVAALRDMLDGHLCDEDEQIMPAMQLYLSADAYRWYERQLQRNTPLSRLRFTVPWLARYARPDERRRLLAAFGWPSRFLLAAYRPGFARLEHEAFGPVNDTGGSYVP
jgi:hypothetical protein